MLRQLSKAVRDDIQLPHFIAHFVVHTSSHALSSTLRPTLRRTLRRTRCRLFHFGGLSMAPFQFNKISPHKPGRALFCRFVVRYYQDSDAGCSAS
mgnify:CR=1 FL=1